MSGSISVANAGGAFGLLGILVSDAGSARQRLDGLIQQAGDGLVSDTYAGLGGAAAVSLALEPAIAHHTAWQNDIGAASGQMQVAQTALSNISSIATTFYAATNTLNGLSAGTVDVVAAQARAALTQVAGLLDSRDGSTYVFAGQDSANPPVPNPDAIWSSGFAASIQAAVGGLAGSGSAAVIASTLAIASSNAPGTSPFSAALSQPAPAVDALRGTVQVGQSQRVPSGILASANGDIASLGSSTTGSYMRDIMRALATLGSLSSSQLSDPGFAGVINDARTSLGDAITALNQDAGVMGTRQTQLTATATQLQNTADAMTAQVGAVQSVDMAKTLSSLSATQTQLQASYQIIAGLQSLSLTKYLAGG